MVKAWVAPEFTETAPEGDMAPLVPVDAVIVYEVLDEKEAETVWLAVILDSV
jgi:hypothetical protein